MKDPKSTIRFRCGYCGGSCETGHRAGERPFVSHITPTCLLFDTTDPGRFLMSSRTEHQRKGTHARPVLALAEDSVHIFRNARESVE